VISYGISVAGVSISDVKRCTTKLFRKWENCASEMKDELVRLYPREMAEPLRYKERACLSHVLHNT
jgi:hypothetical protein